MIYKKRGREGGLKKLDKEELVTVICKISTACYPCSSGAATAKFLGRLEPVLVDALVCRSLSRWKLEQLKRKMILSFHSSVLGSLFNSLSLFLILPALSCSSAGGASGLFFSFWGFFAGIIGIRRALSSRDGLLVLWA